MNPFGQIISPSLFVHIIVIALGKRCARFVKLVSPVTLGERAVLWISIGIMFFVGWIVSLFVFSILVLGFADEHSNIHLLVELYKTLELWVHSGWVGWRELVLTLVPVPIAVVATVFQLHSLIQKKFVIQQKA